MTEQEWLTCTDSASMLALLRGKASDRKLRLFACACCRQFWHLLTDQRSRHAVDIAERFVDRIASHAERAKAAEAAVQAVDLIKENGGTGAARAAAEAAAKVADSDWPLFARFFEPGVGLSSEYAWSAVGASTFFVDRVKQCSLLRDIFGPVPCLSMPPCPEAIAPLAEGIYAGRSDLMPFLGEWLQEHGHWDVGEHCLDERVEHVKGCWVVDWVTGRE
jgi:hypothetical protein